MRVLNTYHKIQKVHEKWANRPCNGLYLQKNIRKASGKAREEIIMTTTTTNNTSKFNELLDTARAAASQDIENLNAWARNYYNDILLTVLTQRMRSVNLLPYVIERNDIERALSGDNIEVNKEFHSGDQAMVAITNVVMLKLADILTHDGANIYWGSLDGTTKENIVIEMIPSETTEYLQPDTARANLNALEEEWFTD